jgi:gas vesicle protein
MKSTHILLGLLTGFAAGAITGILLAPDKGSKTRRQLLDTAEDFSDGLRSKLNAFRDTISAQFESAKEEAEAVAAKGKSKYADLKKEVRKVT